MSQKPKIVIVVAISRGKRALGMNGKLLWHIPEDMKRFKTLTMGHPVIMGRKTFESILEYLKKPLPGRTNIVITRDENYVAPDGVLVVHSLDEALTKAGEIDRNEIHIGGGAQLYAEALPHVDRLELTLIDDEPEADTFFPEYESLFTKKISEEKHEHHDLVYSWVTLEK